MARLLDVSLLQGGLPVAIFAVAAAGALTLLAGRGRRWWQRSVPLALAVGAVAAVAVAVAVDRVWRPFPDPLPAQVVVAVGALVAAVGLAVLGWRARSRWTRVVSLLAVPAVLLGGAQWTNLAFQAYPTPRTALGLPPADERPFADIPPQAPLVAARPGHPLSQTWTPPAGMPAEGAVTQVDIPATRSGFAARQAWLYLPPAYLASPRALLPVLVLMGGQPGGPDQWFDGGRLAARMDAYASEHDGLAPVVVVADDLGSATANPLCMDSRLSRVATYLSADVPAWVRTHLQVDPDPSRWAVGGFSGGATCALQLAVNAPRVYPTFVFISGEDGPTLGDHARTVRAAFGGDEAAFAAVNPLDVLARTRFPGSAGFLVGGAQDTRYLPQAKRVHGATKAAGMDVRMVVIPGDHSFDVWGPGLSDALPWLGTRLRLTP
jgi:S-formylglutathione hydrolase FrmB